MGKNKTQRGSALGRSIIKDRFRGKQHKASDSFLHTSEVGDGYDWGRLNLRSVTDQNQLDEFLATAELAGTEFTAEKLNVKILDENRKSTAPSAAELALIKEKQELNKDLLRIPRRPAWNASTTAAELDHMEKTSFLSWRRDLSQLQEVEHLLITPYERNLEFWRQLWRVIEKSDIIIQIVDGRNPLLFHCKDLENYVTEVNKHKRTVVLVNKSDLLTDRQRQYWADYFTNEKTKVLFWSALQEQQKIDAEGDQAGAKKPLDEECDGTPSQSDDDDDDDDEEEEEEEQHADDGMECGKRGVSDEDKGKEDDREDIMVPSLNAGSLTEHGNQHSGHSQPPPYPDALALHNHAAGATAKSLERANGSELLDSNQLISALKALAPPVLGQPGVLTVGLVGYPNVGKSLTINALLRAKKVSVSATPGKTKHFQTLYVDPTLLLCDCPGLVMPSFVSTKSEMIVSGILPIDQMRDHLSPVDLVCHRIPKRTLEILYGINLPKPGEGEDPARPPTSEELLNAYGYVRGYMTSSGVPDCSRTARLILKDYVNGKLLYCHPPPGISETEFESVPSVLWKHDHLVDVSIAVQEKQETHASKIDSDFFQSATHLVHVNGTRGAVLLDGHRQVRPQGVTDRLCSEEAMPHKSSKKHGNRNKKEKTRRLYSHHDRHNAF